MGSLLVLSNLRAETGAEFAFSSLVVVPVIVITWIDGHRKGLLFALIAAAIVGMGELASGREFSESWIPLANVITRALTYLAVSLLVSKIRQQLLKEHDLAFHDPLTGLLNRRAFLEAGANEVLRSSRYDRPLTVVFMDLDHFKQLNDTMGHDAGDLALRATARTLQEVLRQSDRIGRLGGDEFAVLLPEIGYAESIEAGEKILHALNLALDKYPPVNVSIGVAWFSRAKPAFPEMVKAADELMYEAKQNATIHMQARKFEV